MKLLRLGIHNYKSLRSVEVEPGPLSVLVGPNAGGKSNFCDALDFLGEMYRWGLELAVARHGGFENISYRRARRSTSPIRFEISASVDARSIGPPFRRERTSIIVNHSIEFKAASQRIQAPFHIVTESIKLSSDSQSEPLLELERRGNELSTVVGNPEFERFLGPLRSEYGGATYGRSDYGPGVVGPTQSAMEALSFFFRSRLMGAIRVFEPDPSNCRDAGVATPNPELDRSGKNLPALINFMKSQRQQAHFRAVMDALTRVMPTLRDIEVITTPQKKLSLAFHETGFGRAWTTEEASDGTIRALALLAAVFDPAIDVVAIEEPENSLHPWAIREFVDACRVAARRKQIVLTTHSPVLINYLTPSEIWVVQRPQAETRIDPLSEMDSVGLAGVEFGEYSLSDYLHSGALPASVPAPPS